MPVNQHTIADEVTLDGRGLFLGRPGTVTFKPAPVNHGVVFLRTDVTEGDRPVHIPALIDYVSRQPRRTVLRNAGQSIETCEHILSAVAGLALDNLLIEVHGPEIPAGDGSSAPFVEALQEAGFVEQDHPRRIMTITEPVTVEQGDAMIAALPAEVDGLQVLYDLDYGDGHAIPRQVHAFHLGANDYAGQLAPCRTFVLEEEAHALQAAGLGKHLTPEDVLVIGDRGPLGDNALRFDNELVRHKVLDVIGDLALLGCALRGRIVAYKSGHALNHRLVRRLAAQYRAQRHRQLLDTGGRIDVRAIQRILPHRYPMLLIDRVLEVEGSDRAVGVKNVTVNEPFFSGHYPGTPIMPGVLIVEAMAQMSGVLLSRKLEHTGKLAVLLSMDKVKLRKPVTPGDQLVIEARAIRVRSRTGHTHCKAYVGEHLAAEAEIKFMLVDAEQE